jgi:hypothetical protein
MAFNINTPGLVGVHAPGTVSTVQEAAVGLIIQGFDAVAQNFAEFIYLPGVAATVAGSVVVYDTFAKSTTLAVAASRGPVAVATAATVAGTFGWYQIEGTAVVSETGATAGSKPYAGASAGTPSITVVATNGIDGMTFKTADGTPAAGFAYAQLSRPAMNNLG